MWAYRVAMSVSPLERSVAGEALVGQARERVLVGLGVHRPPLDLLGRHVGDRPQECRRAGDPRLGEHPLRQAEVTQVRVLPTTSAAHRQEDVARLHVAVDQSRLVGRVEGARNLGHDPRRAGRLERAVAADQRRKVHPVDEAHRDVQHAVRLAGVVHRDHVRVVERARRPRLAEEPLAELLLAGDLRGNDLQRDLPPQADVLGAVHHAHPAATDDLLDLVAGDLRPR